MKSIAPLRPAVAPAMLLLLAGCGGEQPAANAAAPLAATSPTADSSPDEATPAAAAPAAASPEDASAAPAGRRSGTSAGAAIRFPPGATAVTLAGSLPPDGDRSYTLDASAGQRAAITLRGSGAAIAMNVYAPESGPGGPALFRGPHDGNVYRGALPADGAYTIQIYRMTSGAAAAPYRLDVRVEPVGSAAAALPGAPADRPAQAITDYYGDLDRGDYRAAYRQWERDGAASGKSLAAFRAGFADTRHTDVTTGAPGRVEGAAGSQYVTVPVTVDAVLRDGSRQHFTGSYVLRRVNDVPGSDAADRRWRIHSANLKRTD